MPSRAVQFFNTSGERLAGRLEMPADKAPQAYALYAHCFTCTKNLKAAVNICKTLALNGIASLRFDFSGLGESGGDFSKTTFSKNRDDLISAARFLHENYSAPKLLIGHSLGGAVVLSAAGEIAESRAVAVIGVPFDSFRLKNLRAEVKEELEERGEAEITVWGRSYKISKSFMADIDSVDLERSISALKRALLILHSPDDKIVDIKNACRIFSVAKHPKSFLSLDGADHLLMEKKDAVYAGSLIAGWAAKYTDRDTGEPPL